MKKIIFMLAAVSVLFAACEKTPEIKPAVSFETAVPVLTEGVATLTLKVDQYTGTEAVTVPVTFSGTAVKGTDYTVSAEEFVFGGADPVTTITVTQIVYDATKTVTATLDIPEGFIAGAYPTSTFNFSGKTAYCSFGDQATIMNTKASVVVGTYDGNGSPYKLKVAAEIPFKINTEKSTAVEGEHFNVVGDKKVIIDAEQKEGKIELEAIKFEKGKDKIVLTLDPSGKFGIGQAMEATITIVSYADNLVGKWVIKEFTPMQEFIDMWYVSTEDMAGYPVFNAADSFTIDDNTGKFIPDFKSEFKNYFIGESNFVEGEMYTLRGMTNVEVQLYELDNTNRYFSATEQSEAKDSYVGVVLSQDGKEITLYLIDHNTKTWLSIYSDFLFNPDRPTATQSSTYIVATFTKAE